MSIILEDIMTDKQMQNLKINKAGAADIPLLWEMAAELGRPRDADYYERNLEFQDQGERDILLVRMNGVYAGYCIYNRKPKYGFFLKLGIPEIQDINVLREFRRQGLAKAMIHHCENLAVKEGFDQMGIGVGLDSSYGPAQILYAGLGYVPDGNGVTYDRRPVMPGEFRMVDDNLCLMMVKTLKKA